MERGARHLRLVVEYDGTGLAGWQRQDNAPSVQQHLEEALETMLGHPVRIAGASRTDAGVHARGQVASFRTDHAIPAHGLRRGLNGCLPPGIAVVAVDEVGDDFHPRFSATGKHYRYTLLLRAERSPRWHGRAWHRIKPVDLGLMTAAARPLVGEHDFAAFRAAGCTADHTVRRVDAIDVDPIEPGVVAIDVRGNAFLRQMVRILVGTLVEVGDGRLPLAQIPEILASRDRTRAGMTAPAHGLELVSVRYDGTRPLRRPGADPGGANDV